MQVSQLDSLLRAPHTSKEKIVTWAFGWRSEALLTVTNYDQQITRHARETKSAPCPLCRVSVWQIIKCCRCRHWNVIYPLSCEQQVIQTVTAVDKDDFANGQRFSFASPSQLPVNPNFTLKDNEGNQSDQYVCLHSLWVLHSAYRDILVAHASRSNKLHWYSSTLEVQ